MQNTNNKALNKRMCYGEIAITSLENIMLPKGYKRTVSIDSITPVRQAKKRDLKAKQVTGKQVKRALQRIGPEDAVIDLRTIKP